MVSDFMKRLAFAALEKLILLLLSMASLGVSSIASEMRDLVILSGQSNAVGFDAVASELVRDGRDDDVLFWWRCGDPPPDRYDSTSGLNWTSLQPQPKGVPLARDSGEAGEVSFGLKRQYGNFASVTGGFGPEFGFVRRLREIQPQRRIAILKVAFSGTGMRTDWNKEDLGDGGACYRALVSEIKHSIAAAKQKEIEFRPRAFLWVQGESDANAIDAPNYAKALASMIDGLRVELGAPHLPALIGVNVQYGNGKNQFMPLVVEAQKSIAANDSVRCRYVDTAGAQTLLPSRTHFSTDGTLEVGRRFADALLDFEGRSGR
jgi:hypothetical protein